MQRQDSTTKQLRQALDVLRERLARLMETESWSQRTAALKIGVSHGALSPWLKGTYTGSSDTVAEKVREFFERRRELAAMPVSEREVFPVTAETDVFVSVTRAIRNCHLKGKIGVVTAPWGAGKTRTAKQYKEQHSGVILVECHYSFPAKMVLTEIANEVGVEARGSIHELLIAICEKLKRTERVLILDEAEHLQATVLDVLRNINDRAGIGIVYLGIPRLMNQFQTIRKDYGYIWSRVRVREAISHDRKTELADVRVCLESVLPMVSDEVATAFHKFSGSDMRKLEELFFAALAVSKRSGKDISGKLVTAVAQQLKMEVI